MSEIKINNIPVITENNGSVSVTTSTIDANGIILISGNQRALRFEKNDGTLDNIIYYNNGTSANKLSIGRDSSVLALRTDGIERMSIDSSGYVTMPYQPAWFYAGGTALTTSTYIVTKPGTAYISSPHYNTSTGLFTAPISGNYLVGVEGLIYPHSGNVMTNRWEKNGGQYGHVIQSGGENNNHTHLSWTQLVYLSENDTIGFAINRSGSTENAYSTQWHQWGYLIG